MGCLRDTGLHVGGERVFVGSCVQQQSFANHPLICHVHPAMRARFWHPLTLQARSALRKQRCNHLSALLCAVSMFVFSTAARNGARAQAAAVNHLSVRGSLL